jgi:hypothetical protein
MVISNCNKCGRTTLHSSSEQYCQCGGAYHHSTSRSKPKDYTLLLMLLLLAYVIFISL